jgi:hypothetical protein
MAAVFIRYLDAKGKLPEIYFEVRDHHLNANLTEFTSYRTIVEEKLGMNVTAIDQDFVRWFDLQRPPVVDAQDSKPTCSTDSPNAPACPTYTPHNIPANQMGSPARSHRANEPPNPPSSPPPQQ